MQRPIGDGALGYRAPKPRFVRIARLKRIARVVNSRRLEVANFAVIFGPARERPRHLLRGQIHTPAVSNYTLNGL